MQTSTDLTCSHLPIAEATSRETLPEQKLLNKNARLLFWVTLTFFTSLHMFAIPLPLYIDYLGGDARDIGLISATLGISAILTRPFLSRMGDLHGLKKILFVGMLAAIISSISFLLSADFLWLKFVRVIQGLGLAGMVFSTQIMITDSASIGRRGKALASQGVASALGLFIGPILGQWIVLSRGYNSFFVSAAMVAAAGLFLVLFVKEPNELNNIDKPVSPDPAQWKELLDGELFARLGTGFCVAFCFGAVLTFLPVFVDSLGKENQILLFMFIALFIMLGRYLAGRTSDWLNPVLIVCPAVLFVASGAFLLSWKPYGLYFYLAAALVGTGFGAGQMGLLASIIKHSSSQNKNLYVSSYANVIDLGIVSAGVTLGVVAFYTSYSVAFAAAGCFAIAAGLPPLYYWKREQ